MTQLTRRTTERCLQGSLLASARHGADLPGLPRMVHIRGRHSFHAPDREVMP